MGGNFDYPQALLNAMPAFPFLKGSQSSQLCSMIDQLGKKLIVVPANCLSSMFEKHAYQCLLLENQMPINILKIMRNPVKFHSIISILT